MRVKVAIIICLTVLLAGCAISDTAELKHVVKEYDKKLATALACGNAEVLTECATKDQIGKVYIFISQLLMNNKLLKAELVNLKFVEARKVTAGEVEKLYNQRKERLEKQNLFVAPFEVSDKVFNALVRTKETWKYTYIDCQNGQPTGEVQSISYQTTYFLLMKKDRWLIDTINTIEIPLTE